MKKNRNNVAGSSGIKKPAKNKDPKIEGKLTLKDKNSSKMGYHGIDDEKNLNPEE
jgi:hypothetical protein